MLPVTFKFSGLLRVLVLSLIPVAASAQQFTPMFPSMADGPVHWLDYDNDGDQDYVTTVHENYMTRPALFNNHNGNFVRTEENFDMQQGQFKILDYEADGDQDVIIYDQIARKARLFKNINGVFTGEPFYFIYSTMRWIDYDKDGDDDLVGSTIDGITFAENINGILTHRLHFYPRPLTWDAGDFNSDGLCDLVVVFENYQHDHVPHVYLGRGDHMEEDQSAVFPEGYTNVYVYAGDYDRDGDDDINMQGSLQGEQVWHNLMFRNDNGIFMRDTDPLYDKAYPANADDDPEKEYYLNINGTAGYYNRMPDGSFELITGRIPYDIYSLRSVSYSNPGNDDTYIALYGELQPNHYGTRIYHRKNGVPEPIYFNPLDAVPGAMHLQFADFDNDGLKDIFSSGSAYYGPQLLKNTGNRFELTKRLPAESTGSGQWIDFDGDGALDLVTNVNNEMRLLKGFGANETTTSQLLLTSVHSPASFTVIDYDKDGDNDIMVEDYMQGLYVNNNGVFNQFISFASSYRDFGKSAWADYDRDGDLDIVMFLEDYSQERLRYFVNSGTGFTDAGEIFPKNMYGTPYAADFNLDGYSDIFYIGDNFLTATAGLYFNNKGIFTAATTNVFSDLVKDRWYNVGAQIVDFDADGYPDIVVMGNTYNSGERITRFYRNNKGTFEVFDGHGIPQYFNTRFHFDDIDNDGDPDLLFAGFYNNTGFTQVYINGVVDIVGPVVTTVTPVDGGVLSFNNGYKLTLSYHEKITKGSGKISLYRESDAQLLMEIDVNSPEVSIQGNMLTISIDTDPFQNYESLYILLDEGVVTDRQNNPSPAVTDVTKWNVTVANGKTDQTITFNPIPAKVLGEAPFRLEAVASSGLPVTFTSDDPTVAVVTDGNLLEIINAGEVTITAAQDGNSSFNRATPVTQHLVINPVILGAGNSLAEEGGIYPNPASTYLTVRTAGFTISEPTTVTISDQLGRVLHTEKRQATEFSLPVENLPPGLYHLMLQQGGKLRTHSFIRQ